MTRPLTRKNFHNSDLIRTLTDFGLVETIEPDTGFAEKLALCLSLNDALALYAVHKDKLTSLVVTQSGHEPTLLEEFSKLKTSLTNSIIKNNAAQVEHTQVELLLPALGETLDLNTAYEPHRRYYLSQQRDIESKVRPWRTHVRAVLSKASPTLKQLAALDEVFDEALSARESKLLATVPVLLKQRFVQLCKAHQHALASNDCDAGLNPGRWLAGFTQDMQTALLAELDVRLQPTLGLIEAFNKEKTRNS